MLTYKSMAESMDMDVSIDVNVSMDVIMDMDMDVPRFFFALELMRITLVRSDKSQELTECLLQSQFYQTLQLNDD